MVDTGRRQRTPVQLGTHVPNARAHIFKMSVIRTIMGLQDMWVVTAVNAYKACRQAATVQRQHYRPLAWHHYSAKRLNSTASHN
jgi:hypothetical protein